MAGKFATVKGTEDEEQGIAQATKHVKLDLGPLAALVSMLILADQAQAIPVFARKYATSCITCHTIYPKLNDVGEAFRRNGYQFPAEEDVLVKEEPIKLGTDAYKEMFPNSIWPSTLPSIPPVSIFTLSQNIVNLQPHGQLKTWDFVFPSDIELIGAGAFGKNISGLYNLGFSPSDGASVGRVFVQFSNLFAGMRRKTKTAAIRLDLVVCCHRTSSICESGRSIRPSCRTSSPRNRLRNFRRCRQIRSRSDRPVSFCSPSSRRSKSAASTSSIGRTRWGSPTAEARSRCPSMTTPSRMFISTSLIDGSVIRWTACSAKRHLAMRRPPLRQWPDAT